MRLNENRGSISVRRFRAALEWGKAAYTRTVTPESREYTTLFYSL